MAEVFEPALDAPVPEIKSDIEIEAGEIAKVAEARFQDSQGMPLRDVKQLNYDMDMALVYCARLARLVEKLAAVKRE